MYSERGKERQRERDGQKAALNTHSAHYLLLLIAMQKTRQV